jgi:hypothetical protein
MAKTSAAKRGGKRPRTPSGATGSGNSRALVESMRADLFEGIAGGPDGDVPAIDRAQDLVYDAWEAPSAKKRRELAEEALRISGDCADAYNILADLASDPAEARPLREGGCCGREGARGGLAARFRRLDSESAAASSRDGAW